MNENMTQTPQASPNPQAAAPIPQGPQPGATASQVKIAGAGRRVVAFILDSIFAFLPLVVLMILYSIVSFAIVQTVGAQVTTDFQAIELATQDARSTTAGVMNVVMGLFGLLGIVLVFLYFPIVEGKYSRGLGKKILNLKIVKQDNLQEQGIGFWMAAARLLATQSGSVLGWIWAFLNPERQAWQDLITKTYVLYDENDLFNVQTINQVQKQEPKKNLFIILLVIFFLLPILLFMFPLFLIF
ncbi:MAG: hypothetical protein GF365_03420 [Candidatus Buchananbacteria bacterium]|nr:hypothetical protein [Candidatus Buchananbacteria bacterium]